MKKGRKTITLHSFIVLNRLKTHCALNYALCIKRSEGKRDSHRTIPPQATSKTLVSISILLFFQRASSLMVFRLFFSAKAHGFPSFLIGFPSFFSGFAAVSIVERGSLIAHHRCAVTHAVNSLECFAFRLYLVFRLYHHHSPLLPLGHPRGHSAATAAQRGIRGMHPSIR